MRFLLLAYAAALLFLHYFAPPINADVPCAPVKTRPCPGENPKATLVGVFLQDCFEEPCAFKRDQNVTMEMDIEFNGNVTRLEASLYALLGGLPIKWDGINKEACEDIVSEGDCPFYKGDYITYGVTLYILPNYPTVRTDVKYIVHDENGETQICWIVKAQVS